MTNSVTIPVTFNYDKYNNFNPYKDRWLEMINARFNCNHFLFDVSVVKNEELILHYKKMPLSQMKKMIQSITL